MAVDFEVVCGFRIRVFKLHLLPSMWPILVEFGSASSEITRRKKKKERKKKESLVKHKSVDIYYVGRPKRSKVTIKIYH